MEALCKKVRKFSVSTADPNADSLDNTSSVNKEYEVSDAEKEDEKHFLRLQNDWIARSLTSIAPRYHAQTGECTIQSCLAQFTAPELLTGPNKWACDKCTRLHAEMTPESTTEDNTTENTKPKTIYRYVFRKEIIFQCLRILKKKSIFPYFYYLIFFLFYFCYIFSILLLFFQFILFFNTFFLFFVYNLSVSSLSIHLSITLSIGLSIIEFESQFLWSECIGQLPTEIGDLHYSIKSDQIYFNGRVKLCQCLSEKIIVDLADPRI